MLRDALRCLGCLIFCVFLVLLVPSSAWSQDTVASSESSESPSPSPSPSVSEQVEPQGESSSSSPSPSASTSDAEPAPAEPSDTTVPEPTPTVTETVTAEPQPVETTMAGTEAEPTIVRLDNESTALMLLGIGLSVLCLGVMAVTSFGGK